MLPGSVEGDATPDATDRYRFRAAANNIDPSTTDSSVKPEPTQNNNNSNTGQDTGSDVPRTHQSLHHTRGASHAARVMLFSGRSRGIFSTIPEASAKVVSVHG